MDMESLGPLITALLQNPQALQAIMSLLGGLQRPQPAAPAAQPAPEPAQPAAAAPDPPPQAAGQAPAQDFGGLLGMLSSLMNQNKGAAPAQAAGAAPADTAAGLMSALSGLGGSDIGVDSRGHDLLYAVKPYLRKSRQDKIEGALQLLSVSKAISAASGSFASSRTAPKKQV